MAEVEEHQRQRGVGVLCPRAVVVAQRFVDGEEVVGPAVGDRRGRRRARVVEVVGGVMRGELVGDGALLGAVGLPGVDLGEPGGEIGVGVDARRRVVAARLARGVEAGDE
jgi:hypothetical protein